MAKLVCLDAQYYPFDDYGYWCPGCKSGHEIAVTKKNASGAKWTFRRRTLRKACRPATAQ